MNLSLAALNPLPTSVYDLSSNSMAAGKKLRTIGIASAVSLYDLKYATAAATDFGTGQIFIVASVTMARVPSEPQISLVASKLLS